MNVTGSSLPDEIVLEPGDAHRFDMQDQGISVVGGRAELHAWLVEDGAPASRRQFLFELAAGDLIPPLMARADGLALALVATEAARLAPVSLSGLAGSAEDASSLPSRIDRWISQLCAAMGAMLGQNPEGTVAEGAGADSDGTKFTLAQGASVTLRGGAGWCASSDATLISATGQPVPRFGPIQATPLAPGLWLTAETAGTVMIEPTARFLQQTIWPEVLAGFHKIAFDLVRARLVARDEALLDLARARRVRTDLGLDRTLGRFTGLLEHAPAWTGAAAPDERLLGPFVMVCDALGIDLTQKIREAVRRAASVEEAARAAKIRQRQIALRGDWWREDFGPFIGFLDDDKKPVAVLRAGAKHWRLVDPDGGRDRIVDAKIAARLQPQGYMLYRAFPARPVTLRDVLFLGWKQNRGDARVALIGALAIGLLGLATPLAMRLAFDRFIPSHETPQLVQLCLGLILAAVISAGFRLAYDMALLRIDGRMAAQTQAAVIDRILRLPPATLRNSSADLAQRAMSVDRVRRTTVNFVLGSLAAFFAWLVNAALMAWYAPLATLLAVLSCLALFAAAWLAATRQLDANRRGAEILSDVNSLIFHLIRGIGVLRTSGAEARAFARWGHDFAEMRARAYRSQRVSAWLETFFAGFDVITMAGVFIVLASVPAKDFSTGAFVSFVSAYGIFIGSSIQIARGLTALVGARPSWERSAVMLRNIPEGGVAKRDPGVLTGDVEMTNVAFRYGADTPMVLSGLSLKIAPGEFVALVGASGSGKSTTARLLLGNIAPLVGTIQYDSMDLQHLDLQLVRRQIGVVLQSGKLMPGSIYENIMGPHHGTLDDAWDAARQAGIEAEIKSLPMGMHTILTEATAAFSGGQIQRFMIARALVGKPRILVLDEATSALDNATQAVVTAALSRLAVTRIVIAHRLSTVKTADRICVFDAGRIVQTGSYDELIAASGPFAELARRQLL